MVEPKKVVKIVGMVFLGAATLAGIVLLVLWLTGVWRPDLPAAILSTDSVEQGEVLELETAKYYRLVVEYEWYEVTIKDNSTVVYVNPDLTIQILNSHCAVSNTESQVTFVGDGSAYSLQPIISVKKNVKGQWQLQPAAIGAAAVVCRIGVEELDAETPFTAISFVTSSNTQSQQFYSSVYGPTFWLFGSETLHFSPRQTGISLPVQLSIDFDVEENEGQTTIVNVISTSSEVYTDEETVSLADVSGISNFQIASIATIPSLSSQKSGWG